MRVEEKKEEQPKPKPKKNRITLAINDFMNGFAKQTVFKNYTLDQIESNIRGVVNAVHDGNYIVYDIESNGYKDKNNTQEVDINDDNGHEQLMTSISMSTFKDGKKVGSENFTFQQSKITNGAKRSNKDSVSENDTATRNSHNEKEMKRLLAHLSNNNLPMIAHNGVNFDSRILQYNIEQYSDSNYIPQTLDSMPLTKLVNSMDNGDTKGTLDTLINMAGLKQRDEAHLAEEDVQLTADGIKYLANRFSKQNNSTTKTAIKSTLELLNDESLSPKQKAESLALFVTKTGANVTQDIRDAINNIEYFLSSDRGADTNFRKNKKGEKDFAYSAAENWIRVDSKISSIEDFIKYINHEVEHAQTAHYIHDIYQKNKTKTGEMKFLTKFLNDGGTLRGLIDKVKDKLAKNRLEYVMSHTDEAKRLSEFVAVFRAEPNVRAAMENALGGHKAKVSLWNRLKTAVGRIINKSLVDINSKVTIDTITEAINGLSAYADRHEEEVSLNEVFDSGPIDDMSDQEVKDYLNSETLDQALHFRQYRGAKRLAYTKIGVIIEDLNSIFANKIRYVTDAIGRVARNKKVVKNLDKLGNKYKIINDMKSMAKKQFRPGSILDKMWGYLQLKDNIDYRAMEKMHTAVEQARQVRNRIDTEKISKAKSSLDKVGLSDSEMKALTLIMESSVSDLADVNNGTAGVPIMDRIIDASDSKAELDKVIKEFEDKLTAIYGDNRALIFAKEIAKFDVNREVSETLANMGDNTQTRLLGTENKSTINSLSALYSLKTIKGSLKAIGKVKEHEVYNELMLVSIAAKYAASQADLDDKNRPTNRLVNRTGSKIVYKKRYDFVQVKESKYKEYVKNKKGVLIREPKDSIGKIGLVAIEKDSFGFRSGVVSSIYLNNDGIHIKQKNGGATRYRSTNNAIPTGVQKFSDDRIILTREEMNKLEIETNPFDSLYRGLAHNQEVFETKKLFNNIINHSIMTVKTNDQIDSLVKILNAKNKKDMFGMIHSRKEPMFLDVDMDLYDGLPEAIKRTYVKPKFISNVMDLDKKITLVHKSFSDDLSGYERSAVVSKENKKLYQAEKIWRNLVVMFKAHVVMGNPKKIAKDGASNVSILMAYDVPFTSMAKYGKESIKLNGEITKLRNKLIDTQIERFGTTDKDKISDLNRKILVLKKRIENHAFAPALNNGFIQSIGTDLISKESDAISGLKVDLDKVFTKLTDYKQVRKSLSFIANFGFSAEDVLSAVNNLAVKKNSTVEAQLKETIKTLKKIRKKDDMVGYLHQLVATPGHSELIKHGSSATLYIDLMSRWILYKHLIDAGMGEAEAAHATLMAFIDYRTNLPAELDMLSATGIWLFPQFTIKIKRLLAILATQRPLTSAVGIGGSLALGTYPASIYATVGNGVNTIDLVDGNMFVPKEAFSF